MLPVGDRDVHNPQDRLRGHWQQIDATPILISAPQWLCRPCNAPRRLYRVGKKLSVKADLAIYSQVCFDRQLFIYYGIHASVVPVSICYYSSSSSSRTVNFLNYCSSSSSGTKTCLNYCSIPSSGTITFSITVPVPVLQL